MPKATLSQQRAAIARAERIARSTGDGTQALEARRDYKVARLEKQIADDLSTEPAFTTEQRVRLAAPLLEVLGPPDELTARRLLSLLKMQVS